MTDNGHMDVSTMSEEQRLKALANVLKEFAPRIHDLLNPGQSVEVNLIKQTIITPSEPTTVGVVGVYRPTEKASIQLNLSTINNI